MSRYNDKNRRDFIKKFAGSALLTAASSGPLFAGERAFSQELPWNNQHFLTEYNAQYPLRPEMSEPDM